MHRNEAIQLYSTTGQKDYPSHHSSHPRTPSGNDEIENYIAKKLMNYTLTADTKTAIQDSRHIKTFSLSISDTLSF